MAKRTVNKKPKPKRRIGRPRNRANDPTAQPISLRNEGSPETLEESSTPEDAQILNAMQESQLQLQQQAAQQTPAQQDTYPELEEYVSNYLPELLGTVAIGVFPHVVAAAQGVPKSIWEQWMLEGKRDYEARVVSPQARIYGGVIKQVAIFSAKSESEVSARFPQEYLRKGPRTMLGDEWKEVKEMVWADKLGILNKQDAVANIGTQVVLNVDSIHQVMGILKDYAPTVVGEASPYLEPTKQTNLTHESEAIEQVVRNREEIISTERPHYDLSALKGLR